METKPIYLILAAGFEETEAICPLDVLRRAKLNVKTVAVGSDLQVVSSRGVSIKADLTLPQIKGSVPAAVILPGGMPGADNLDIPELHELLFACRDNGGLLAAICAAPKVLGGLGLLTGKKAVCYPGFEKYLKGAELLSERVVCQDRIVTAVGMGASLAFGLKILEELGEKEKADEIARSVFA